MPAVRGTGPVPAGTPLGGPDGRVVRRGFVSLTSIAPLCPERMSRTLLTGANGQIGSELVAALRERHGTDCGDENEQRNERDGEGFHCRRSVPSQ